MLLLSCKSEDEVTITNDNKFYTAAGQVSVLNEVTIQYLEQTIEEGVPIVFSSSTPDEALPKIGTIILIPESEKSPYGFLGKVVKVEKGDKITVTTEEVALDEAFEDLSIDTELNLEECFEGVYDEEGNPIEYQLVDSLFQEPDTINPVLKLKQEQPKPENFSWRIISFHFQSTYLRIEQAMQELKLRILHLLDSKKPN